MKKITDHLLGYITYVTDLHQPITVVATFTRILSYFISFMMIFMRHRFLFGLLLLGLTISSTVLGFVAYLLSLDTKQWQDCLEEAKTEYRQLQSEEREEIIASFKDLPREEQIQVLETYIEVCEEAKSEAEMLLERIKHEDES